MARLREMITRGWAPSVSVLLHGLAFAIAVVWAVRPVPPPPGDTSIPISLVAMPAPQPSPPAPAIMPEPEPVAPPVTTMAEAAPVVRAPRKERPEPVHRDEPPRVAQPTERQEPGPQPSSARETAPPSSADAGGPSPAYLALLRQKLERSKVYPRAARQRRQEGTTIVRFVVDREGRVLSRHIEKSSGYGDLDREVDAMLDRAQPLPRMPTEMVQASIELVVPIDFHLR